MDDPEAVTGELPQFRGHEPRRPAHRLQAVLQERDGREFAGRHRRRHRVLQPGGGKPARPHPAARPAAARHQRGAGRQGRSNSRRCSSRTSGASGCRSPKFPPMSSAAFIAAEDKRFHQHRGIDERGLIRAFIGNLTQSGRPQGGSTITQQVVKNLLVGDDLTYERKMREMIVAARVERLLSKDEILELYLNSVFLGRGSWGIEMAARGYFGKPASELTLAEGALLAGADQGAEFLQSRPPSAAGARPLRLRAAAHARGRHDRRPTRRSGDHRRHADADRLRAAAARHRLPFHRSGRARGAHHRRPRRAHRPDLHGPLDHHPQLQRAAETALQEGLARYERQTGRVQSPGGGGQSRPRRSAGSRPRRRRRPTSRPGSRR